MATIRKAKRNKYAAISNQLLQNQSLSFACRGMLAYLLSKPDTWECRVTDIEREGGIGKFTRRKIMLEAEQFGYLTYEKIRLENGRFTSRYTVHETPVLEAFKTRSWEANSSIESTKTSSPPPNLPEAVTPAAVLPPPVTPPLVEQEPYKLPDLSNTDLLNTDLSNTDKTSEEDAARLPEADALPTPQQANGNKKKKESDPRAHHPAIESVKAVIGRYPAKIIWDDIISVVGNTPDPARLQTCAKAWAKKSTNMGNLDIWLFDWYAKGGLASNGNGKSTMSVTDDPHTFGGRPWT